MPFNGLGLELQPNKTNAAVMLVNIASMFLRMTLSKLPVLAIADYNVGSVSSKFMYEEEGWEWAKMVLLR